MGFLRRIDAFRTIPRDFCEGGTVHGALLSALAAVLCMVLFFCELNAYLTVTTRTRIVMDSNQDKLLQINFDITLQDLPCDHVSVGIWDSFGNDRLNITKNIVRQSIDHEGNEKGHAYSDDELIELDSHEQELSEQDKMEYDSDWASSSDSFKHNNFNGVIESHDLTMLLFYADWCPPCRAFKPTWDEFEDIVNGKKPGQMPEIKDADGYIINKGIRVLKINCVEFKQACIDEGIGSYPTVRAYKRAITQKRQYTVYEGERRVPGLLNFLKTEAGKRHLHSGATHHNIFKEGCRLNGFVEVARVPGTLHFESKSSANKMLNNAFTNVSHEIHHFSFGENTNHEDLQRIPTEYKRHIAPLSGKSFYVDKFHMAPHHYIKVVSTTFASWGGVRSYQMTHQHRNANIAKKAVPQAKFSYDLAPVEVIVTQERKKKWYDFFTGALAIVGGTYTVMGITSGAFNMASKAFKQNLGKLT
eukprot:TRINITY_DN43650_c0_g1_i1.p1 TRINITY_DN43650_c0_g1~~TRINITY_DN43650_c0_g1_i1.p1  ORF type:complete len:473 (+),score=164.23 TRINITY_DN43650_c0_g1_i1:77-1495(+)